MEGKPAGATGVAFGHTGMPDSAASGNNRL